MNRFKIHLFRLHMIFAAEAILVAFIVGTLFTYGNRCSVDYQLLPAFCDPLWLFAFIGLIVVSILSIALILANIYWLFLPARTTKLDKLLLATSLVAQSVPLVLAFLIVVGSLAIGMD